MAVVLPDVLVLDDGRRRERHRDRPSRVVRRGEQKRGVGRPVLERGDAARDVDVLPEDGRRVDVERDGDGRAGVAIALWRDRQAGRTPVRVRLARAGGERRQRGCVAPGEVDGRKG